MFKTRQKLSVTHQPNGRLSETRRKPAGEFLPVPYAVSEILYPFVLLSIVHTLLLLH